MTSPFAVDPSDMTDEELTQAIYLAVVEATRPEREAVLRRARYDQEKRGERYLERRRAAATLAPPAPSPLTNDELEHYRWLIDGLLFGAERLTDDGTAKVAIDEARDLFAELVTRIEEEVKRR